MAIQPRFAQAILDGRKTIEFRKRTLARDVRTIVIYETSPTQRLVGEFDLQDRLIAPPANLWQRFKAVGGIDAASYDAYFDGRDKAVGLTISSVRRYARRIELSEITPAPAVPQSFSYLDLGQLAKIHELAAAPSPTKLKVGELV